MWEKALDLYENLPEPPDHVLQTIFFNACASSCNERAIQLGNRTFHTMTKDYTNDTKLLGSIFNMLLKFGQINDAEHLFQTISKKTRATYGAMMQGLFLIQREDHFQSPSRVC